MEDNKNEFDEDDEIENEISNLDASVGNSLSDEEKDNIRKILRYIGIGKKRSKWSIFLTNTRNYLISYLAYVIVYFALFGMMNGVMNYKYNWQVLVFIVSLSFYQLLIKELLKAYLKPGYRQLVGFVTFIGLSIFIIHEFLDITKLLTFSNWFFFIVFYLAGELISFIFKYYISMHIVQSILR